MALVGKLTAKAQPEETNKPAGRSVEELKKRLADIKQFI